MGGMGLSYLGPTSEGMTNDIVSLFEITLRGMGRGEGWGGWQWTSSLGSIAIFETISAEAHDGGIDPLFCGEIWPGGTDLVLGCT